MSFRTYEIQPAAVKMGEERVETPWPHRWMSFMTCIRSKFVPEQFEVHEGERGALGE
jgi:hypothetical protein